MFWNWFNSVVAWWCDPWNFLSGVMSVIALAGTLMNAERNKWGFIFWLCSNLYMSVRFFVIGEYAQGVLFFVYFILAIRGIYSWTKKEKSSAESEKK
ncbi:MAG: nicotinamide mononucleotide transporter [Acutalibacteraceae bacterium]